MNILFRYIIILILLCSTCIFYIYFNLYTEILNKISKNEPIQYYFNILRLSKSQENQQQFTKNQVSKLSNLGKMLFLSKGCVSPIILNKKHKQYLILMWKHGPFLERRHIRRFSTDKYSPWENCSLNSCLLTYDSKALDKADAVIFLLHRTKNVQELPKRTNYNQRWIFLTDESPVNTFLYRNQNITDYNGMFNWSMTFRTDSDIPVLYGRTISTKVKNISKHILLSIESKKKLVAIMGSNCGGTNGRWNYVHQMKLLLKNDLDIYGHCFGGNTTACPGHFSKDCSLLKHYKFYLAFENSNCKEYLTEKVFWNGYEKYAVPIIMGAPKEDCIRLLPPFSFLHVNDFANPAALVNYIYQLHRNNEDYLRYHHWRNQYQVLNEHGYFGSISKHYCRVCEALHYNEPHKKVYDNIELFWNKERDCDFKKWIL